MSRYISPYEREQAAWEAELAATSAPVRENVNEALPKEEKAWYNTNNSASTPQNVMRNALSAVDYAFKTAFWHDNEEKQKEAEREYKNTFRTDISTPKVENLPYTASETPKITYLGSSKVNPGSYTGAQGVKATTSPYVSTIDSNTNENSGATSATNRDSDRNANTPLMETPGLVMKFESGEYLARYKKEHETNLSVEDAAEMAARSYNKYKSNADGLIIEDLEKRKLGEGWVLLREVKGKDGLLIHIYARGDSEDSSYQGPKEYALVNKGSSTPDDWVDNVLQPFGGSTDMDESIDYVKKFVQRAEYDGYKVTFVGHSKGGAEAAANAIATNKDAIIFNPAELSVLNYRPDEQYTGDITSYVVPGDILNTVNEILPFGISFETYELPFYSLNPIKNHSMEAIISALEKEKNKKK